ncbi:hypothetical protein GCM10023339_50000 [Alloalcanivorax gelatiniphagus]
MGTQRGGDGAERGVLLAGGGPGHGPGGSAGLPAHVGHVLLDIHVTRLSGNEKAHYTGFRVARETTPVR